MMKSFGNDQFIKMAFWFEGSLIGLAYILGWIADINPIGELKFTAKALGLGVLGTVPLFVLFLLFHAFPKGSLQTIKQVLHNVLGPSLSACSFLQLFLLAALAGIAEEILFRGVVQPWLESVWGMTAGLLMSNLLFGLVHFISITYAIVAALIGIYLGLFMDAGGERNLLTPVIIHGLYDFLGFLVVAHSFKKTRSDGEAIKVASHKE